MTSNEEMIDLNSNQNKNEGPRNGFLQQPEKSYTVSNKSANDGFSQNSFTTSRHSSILIPEFVAEDSRLELRRKKSMDIQNLQSNITSSLPDCENDKSFVSIPTSSVLTSHTPRNSVSFNLPYHTSETTSSENKQRCNNNIKVKYTNDVYKSKKLTITYMILTSFTFFLIQIKRCARRIYCKG